MGTASAIALSVIGSTIIYLVIAFSVRNRNTTPFAFFYADGNISKGDYGATFSGANITMTSIFVYVSAQAIESGLSAFSVPLFWALGIILFYKLSPRLRSSFERGQTIHQFLGEAYSSRGLQVVTSAVTIFAFVGTVGLEFLGFSWFLQHFNVSHLSVIAIGCFLVLVLGVYSAVAGYWATIKTDWLQVGFTILGCLVLLYIFLPVFGVIDEGLSQSYRANVVRAFSGGSFFQDPFLLIGMVVLLLPFQFSVMDMWQRCVATGGRLERFRLQTLIAGLILAGVFMLPILLALGKGSETGQSTEVFFHVVSDLGHPLLVGLATLMLLASVFSTADTLLVAAANSLVADLFAHRYERSLTSKALVDSPVSVRTCRLATFLLGVVTLAVLVAALMGLRLGELIVAVFGAQSIIGVLVLGAILFPSKMKRRSRGAIAAASVGLLLPLPLVIMGKVWREPDLVNGAPVLSIGAALLVLIFTPERGDTESNVETEVGS